MWTRSILNELEIRHRDAKMIDRIANALTKRCLLNKFAPCPSTHEERLKDLDEHYHRFDEALPALSRCLSLDDWRRKWWGTSSDIWPQYRIEMINRLTIKTLFITEISPPFPVLNRMLELECSISGKIYDDSLEFGCLYDNGAITDDPERKTFHAMELYDSWDPSDPGELENAESIND